MTLATTVAQNRLWIGWSLLTASWVSWFLPAPYLEGIGLAFLVIMLLLIAQSFPRPKRDEDRFNYTSAEKFLLAVTFASFVASLIYRYGFGGTRDTLPTSFGWVSILYLLQSSGRN